jgi:hypothetical protein
VSIPPLIKQEEAGPSYRRSLENENSLEDEISGDQEDSSEYSEPPVRQVRRPQTPRPRKPAAKSSNGSRPEAAPASAHDTEEDEEDEMAIGYEVCARSGEVVLI